MLFQVKLEQPTKFKESMDHEALASFIWSVENFLFLTNLTDPVAQAQLAHMYLVNSTAVWLQYQGYNHDTLTWVTLKADM